MSVYCICKAWHVCAGGSERIKNLFERVRKIINVKVFAGLGLVDKVKNYHLGLFKMLPTACDLRKHFQVLGHNFFLYRPLSHQIT